MVVNKDFVEFQRYMRDTHPHHSPKAIRKKWAGVKDMYAKLQKEKADKREAKKLDALDRKLSQQSRKEKQRQRKKKKQQAQQAASKAYWKQSAAKMKQLPNIPKKKK
jgi:hypothetical protein